MLEHLAEARRLPLGLGDGLLTIGFGGLLDLLAAAARVGKDATGLTIIASGLGTPREVALCTGTGCASDPYLYVSTYAGGTILRVAKTAPAASAMTMLASGQKGPLGIATDAKYIFWANYGTTGVADGTIMKLVKQP